MNLVNSQVLEAIFVGSIVVAEGTLLGRSGWIKLLITGTVTDGDGAYCSVRSSGTSDRIVNRHLERSAC